MMSEKKILSLLTKHENTQYSQACAVYNVPLPDASFNTGFNRGFYNGFSRGVNIGYEAGLKAQQAAVPSVLEGFVVVDLLILGGLHNAALDGKYLREVDECQSKFEEMQCVLAELLEKAQEKVDA